MTSERMEVPVLKLKVSEALSRDVGRGIARIGPEDLERLQLVSGDLIEVTGKRGTVCKAMPAYRELRGQSRIQIDGLVRENAGAGLDEVVQARKTHCRPAERVVLAPANVRPAERDLDYIGNLLDGLPVQAGNRIRATLFGSQWADFRVESTTPKGAVLINPTTQLVIGSPQQAEEVAARSTSYEDIGGLKPQLQRIRNDRVAAALSGSLRAAGHRRAQGRAAPRSARLRKDSDRARHRA
jgi:transitional endoplasmic reticulum ATPase